MAIVKRYSVVLLLLISCCELTAQVSFFYNLSAFKTAEKSITIYADSSRNRTVERYHQIKYQFVSLLQSEPNLSYKDEMLWMKIPYDLINQIDGLRYLMIRNPHINNLNAWILNSDSVVQTFSPTGDHFVFNSRTLPFPDFVFPIQPTGAKDAYFLLLIDKRNEQVNIPIHLLTTEGFARFSRFRNITIGVMMGIGFFLILFSIFLFVQMRERLYIYYTIYIALVFFYIFSDYGFSFMYFFPNIPSLGDFTRPMAISFATPVYLLFALNLLQIKNNFPAYYTWSLRYIYVYFLLLVTAIFLMPDTGPIRAVLVWVMQIYQSLSALLMVILAIAAVRNKIPYSIYIVFSGFVLMITFTVYMQFVSGYIPDTSITRNMMNIGYTAEISLLAFVLTLRFKDYKEQSELLLRNSNLQQEQIFKSISDYQEKEMQRYSSMLHDSVGAQLSAIRLNLESLPAEQKNPTIDLHLKQSIENISHLADDVRQFSHTLSPVLLQKKGLVEAIKENVEGVNRSSTLFIQFESIGSLQITSFRYELMIYNILQELIQNIIKHSGATEAIVQLILEKELISIFVEDNGKGFDQSLHKEGLGFSQIKQLVTFVKGNLTIDAEPQKGCMVSIEFPVLLDETTQPHPDR